MAKFKEFLPYIIIVIVVVLLRTYIVTPGLVNGSSMENTLFDKDLVIINKIGLKSGINRYDIVVVKYNDSTIIKRVIGLPGETLKYEDNTLYINDKKIDEPYLKDATEDFNITSLGYDKIPDDCYFVLGDNRDNSSDSRIIGPVKKSQITGSASLVLFPFSEAGYRK